MFQTLDGRSYCWISSRDYSTQFIIQLFTGIYPVYSPRTVVRLLLKQNWHLKQNRCFFFCKNLTTTLTGDLYSWHWNSSFVCLYRWGTVCGGWSDVEMYLRVWGTVCEASPWPGSHVGSFSGYAVVAMQQLHQGKQ